MNHGNFMLERRICGLGRSPLGGVPAQGVHKALQYSVIVVMVVGVLPRSQHSGNGDRGTGSQPA